MTDTNFVYGNVALPADKADTGGGSAAVSNPTRRWSTNDSNRVFQSLRDLRTVLGDQLVNARTYGAVGDGVTDDTAAIQAALDAAEGSTSVVYIPTGVHIISDTLYVPNKVVLGGVGRGDTGKLKASATFPTDGRAMVRLGRVTDSLVFGCRVELMIIDANSRAKVCVFSSAANEQSGVRFVVATNFTQYGIHFNAASIFVIENVEVTPQSGGATSGIYLQSCAGDNLVKRATIGVSGTLTNGLHLLSTQCIAESIHVEACTTGINLDGSSSAVLIGISGPTVTPNVTDLIVEQGSTRYSVGINLVKNSATRILTASFGGYTNADSFMPLWVGGDSIIGGATHFPREISPSQIVANQNDYNPSGFSSAQVLFLTSDAARDITGFVAGNKGRLIWVYNGGAQNITLKHQTTSTAANRIIGRGGADTVLTPNAGAQLYYSGSQSRWLVLGDTL